MGEKDQIAKKICDLKKKKMQKEFWITALSGFVIPTIFFVFAFASDSKADKCIAVIIGFATVLAYFGITCCINNACIKNEMEIDKLERKYSCAK